MEAAENDPKLSKISSALKFYLPESMLRRIFKEQTLDQKNE